MDKQIRETANFIRRIKQEPQNADHLNAVLYTNYLRNEPNLTHHDNHHHNAILLNEAIRTGQPQTVNLILQHATGRLPEIAFNNEGRITVTDSKKYVNLNNGIHWKLAVDLPNEQNAAQILEYLREFGGQEGFNRYAKMITQRVVMKNSIILSAKLLEFGCDKLDLLQHCAQLNKPELFEFVLSTYQNDQLGIKVALDQPMLKAFYEKSVTIKTLKLMTQQDSADLIQYLSQDIELFKSSHSLLDQLVTHPNYQHHLPAIMRLFDSHQTILAAMIRVGPIAEVRHFLASYSDLKLNTLATIDREAQMLLVHSLKFRLVSDMNKKMHDTNWAEILDAPHDFIVKAQTLALIDISISLDDNQTIQSKNRRMRKVSERFKTRFTEDEILYGFSQLIEASVDSFTLDYLIEKSHAWHVDDLQLVRCLRKLYKAHATDIPEDIERQRNSHLIFEKIVSKKLSFTAIKNDLIRNAYQIAGNNHTNIGMAAANYMLKIFTIYSALDQENNRNEKDRVYGQVLQISDKLRYIRDGFTGSEADLRAYQASVTSVFHYLRKIIESIPNLDNEDVARTEIKADVHKMLGVMEMLCQNPSDFPTFLINGTEAGFSIYQRNKNRWQQFGNFFTASKEQWQNTEGKLNYLTTSFAGAYCTEICISTVSDVVVMPVMQALITPQFNRLKKLFKQCAPVDASLDSVYECMDQIAQSRVVIAAQNSRLFQSVAIVTCGIANQAFTSTAYRQLQLRVGKVCNKDNALYKLVNDHNFMFAFQTFLSNPFQDTERKLSRLIATVIVYRGKAFVESFLKEINLPFYGYEAWVLSGFIVGDVVGQYVYPSPYLSPDQYIKYQKDNNKSNDLILLQYISIVSGSVKRTTLTEQLFSFVGASAPKIFVEANSRFHDAVMDYFPTAISEHITDDKDLKKIFSNKWQVSLITAMNAQPDAARINWNAIQPILDNMTFLTMMCSYDTPIRDIAALLDVGADINRADGNNRTPLAYAYLRGDIQLALLLYEYGAIAAEQDYVISPFVPEQTSRHLRRLQVINRLHPGAREERMSFLNIQYCFSFAERFQEIIPRFNIQNEAMRADFINAIHIQIINGIDHTGASLLHTACEQGQIDNIQYIIDHGGLHFVMQRDYRGRSPLDLFQMTQAVNSPRGQQLLETMQAFQPAPTITHQTFTNGDMLTVDAHAQYEHDKNQYDHSGRTPLAILLQKERLSNNDMINLNLIVNYEQQDMTLMYPLFDDNNLCFTSTTNLTLFQQLDNQMQRQAEENMIDQPQRPQTCVII